MIHTIKFIKIWGKLLSMKKNQEVHTFIEDLHNVNSRGGYEIGYGGSMG
jgi:hypothetical protein